METEGGLFEEGQSPGINRGVLIPLMLLVWQCYRREVQERRSACDMMRLGLKEGVGGGRDELLMAQQVWSPLGNTGAREEGHRHSAEDKGRESVPVCLIFMCL